ncbi:MAG: HAD family hydrolase [Lentisphaerae bacterium]|nr:HAD family hydrolase [Lentisphaerota bacterium]
MENFPFRFPHHGKPVARLRREDPVKPAPSLLDRFSTFIVDMDDTLFEERDYVLGGFRAVADHVVHWNLSPQAVWEFLLRRFQSAGREQIFNHLLLALTGEAPEDRIRELVDVYRRHEPRIELYPGASAALDALRAHGKLILVTDGLTAMQQRKFAALQLDRRVDRVIFCHDTGHPKPDPASLDGAVSRGDSAAVLIGDRPDHDLALAAHLGIASIRVRTGRFRKLPNTPWAPVADLSAFADLTEMIDPD